MTGKRILIGLLSVFFILPLFIERGISQSKKEGPFSAKEPVLITSAGQSADTQMVKVLADRNKITLQFNPLAGPENLREAKSVIVVIGGSTKGMGAAGIDADKEASRVQQLLAKAKELKVPVIAMHIGGKARRGDLSDRFIHLVVPRSSYLIVVKDGDGDELISKTALKNKIPFMLIDKISEAQEPLKSIYAK
jgi:hypothetical protein